MEILDIVQQAQEQYDEDEYQTSYGLLALRYRLANMYFLAKMYENSQWWYEAAYKAIPLTSKYFGDAQVRNLVRMGVANSLYFQNKTPEAYEEVGDILNKAGSSEEKLTLLSQYAGYVGASR